jgi:hypothetical protein
MHVTVKFGAESVKCRIICTKASVPDLLLKPKLAGETALRNSCWNCRAKVLPTSLRRVSPAATPHTLPLGLRKAVSCDICMAAAMHSGILAWAICSAAPRRSSKAVSSFGHNFKYSYLVPPSPGERPRRVVIKHRMQAPESSCKATAGSCGTDSAGTARKSSGGRSRGSIKAASVSGVPGASPFERNTLAA